MQDLRYEFAWLLHIDDLFSLISCCKEFFENLNLRRLAKVYNLTRYEVIKSLKHLIYIWSHKYYKSVNFPSVKNLHENVLDSDLVKIRATIKKGYFNKRHFSEFIDYYGSRAYEHEEQHNHDELNDCYRRAICEIKMRMDIYNNELFLHRDPIIIEHYLERVKRKSLIGLFLKYHIGFKLYGKNFNDLIDYYTNSWSSLYLVGVDGELDCDNIKDYSEYLVFEYALEKDKIEICLKLAARLWKHHETNPKKIKSSQGLAIWLALCENVYHLDVCNCSETIIKQRRPDLLETFLKFIRSRYCLDDYELDFIVRDCIKYDSAECFLKLVEYYPSCLKFLAKNILGYEMKLYLD